MARPEIATLLALSSALCIATGDVLQQQSAHRITDASIGHVALFASLLRNQRWWWGALLLAASIALQAAALGQGSVLLVQALLTLSVLFALPFNARFARRAVTGAEWIWAGLLTVAVTVVVVVGHPRPVARAPHWEPGLLWPWCSGRCWSHALSPAEIGAAPWRPACSL